MVLMLTIGIESSAHTLGVGIVDNGKVLANAKAMYKIGTKGMIPKEVAEHHVQNLSSDNIRRLEKCRRKASAN